MKSTEIPEWLTRLVEESGPPGPLAQDYQSDATSVLPGQMRLVSALNNSIKCIVLVMDSEDEEGLASAVLCTNELDLWTDTDVVLSSEESELPYAILVQTDMAVVVTIAGIGQHIGNVEPKMFENLRQLYGGNVPLDDQFVGRLGMPLQGPRDVRWSGKAEQAKEAWEISSAHLDAFEQ